MQGALLQRAKHVVLQTGIWTTCREPVWNIPAPGVCYVRNQLKFRGSDWKQLLLKAYILTWF